MSNAVTVRPIRSEADLEFSLTRISELIQAEPGSREGDELDVLATLVQAYEREHYPLGLSDPVEALHFHMDRLGLKPKDLAPYIGAIGRVYEVLNRKRGLSLEMIRRLSQGLGIPAESLIGRSGPRLA